LKNTVNEDYIHKVDSIISEFITDEFNFLDSITLESAKDTISPDLLNQTFKEIIED